MQLVMIEFNCMHLIWGSVLLTLLDCFSLRILRAEGQTSLFILSYGGGTPSYTFSRRMAALPRGWRWGNMPAK